ncbi:glutamate racemase [Amorphus suaedae]
MSAPILVFDSGLGGTTVLTAITDLMPGEDIVYLVDDAGFPYGDWDDEAALADRIAGLVADAAAQCGARCAVIACNTASTAALPALRARLSIPVVGTVPAIKPAAERTTTGLVSVLATPGTVRREYTRDLIARFAGNAQVTLVGSPGLAAIAEAYGRGAEIDPAAVLAEIGGCFVDVAGRRTDTVVLGCTHYPLLLAPFAEVAPWPVSWIDPAPAIARRVRDVAPPAASDGGGTLTAIFTAGADRRGEVDRLVAHLARRDAAATSEPHPASMS